MKGDAFEMWWDSMFEKGRHDAGYFPYPRMVFDTKSSDKISSPYLFRTETEYDVQLDDLISDDFVIHTPGEVNISLIDDTSGYVLTTNGGECNWTVMTNAQPNNVCFYDTKGENSLSINFDTGDVKLSAKTSIDEAAKLFWDRVMALNPMVDRKQLDDIEDRSVGKIADYFQCAVIPEINNRIATKVEFLPSGENLLTPEQLALEAYTRAMKVVE